MNLYEDKLHPITEDYVSFPMPVDVRTPWLKSAGDLPTTLKYYNGPIIDTIETTAKVLPDYCAYEFFGSRVTYKKFISQIYEAARALKTQGVEAGNRVTICMPNTPQAIIMFYALNRIGAVANIIHPLSSEEEIVKYINDSHSIMCLTLKQFYPKFALVKDRLNSRRIIVCGIDDGLKGVKKVLYPLVNKEKIALPEDTDLILWKDFIASGRNYKGEIVYNGNGSDLAAILYSGGTTGTSKGVMLSNLNFNAMALQTGTAGNCVTPGDKCLSIMPIFHGFGLGVCINTMLYWGITAILIPRFNAGDYCKLLKKYKPNYIAGVPTLFEALLRMDDAKDLDLSCLKGVFSGGDSLSVEFKRKVDDFLTQHGSKEQVREGYGATESVSACCLTLRHRYKEGSIGIPFPDTYFKICTPSSQDEVSYGTVGEICISGPSIMLGYMDNPKETIQALQLHPDGRIWLHTGDLGTMDKEGFVYFKQRLKRMIITSGYNVYPSQVENIIDSHPAVLTSTVIGVKDDYKMQRVKAFVVLKSGIQGDDSMKIDILNHCSKNLPKYAIPREIEFRTDLPRTLVGKVSYTVLEKEEAEKCCVG